MRIYTKSIFASFNFANWSQHGVPAIHLKVAALIIANFNFMSKVKCEKTQKLNRRNLFRLYSMWRRLLIEFRSAFLFKYFLIKALDTKLLLKQNNTFLETLQASSQDIKSLTHARYFLVMNLHVCSNLVITQMEKKLLPFLLLCSICSIWLIIQIQ